MEPVTLYTLGHGNRSEEQFLAILRAAQIRCLVDVRAQPRSRRHPHFDGDALREALNRAEIVYHWAGRHLGGRRAARPDSPHVALPEDVRGFADHMQSEEFARGLAQLIHLARLDATAMMCAERLPEYCHRRLIADALLLQGVRVVHLIDAGVQREHALSVEVRRESVSLIYDRNAIGKLKL
jgi:uncharacterized protein (DUF488 family)